MQRLGYLTLTCCSLISFIGCREDATLVVMSLVDRGNVNEVVQNLSELSVSLTHQSFSANDLAEERNTRFVQSHGPIVISTETGDTDRIILRADGRSGDAQVTVKAIDFENDKFLASGTAAVLIEPDQTTQVTVPLSQGEFDIINKTTGNTPSFSSETNGPTFGRQMGSYSRYAMVGWRSDEQKKIYVKYIDLQSTTYPPSSSQITTIPDVNDANDTYDQPAIAMQTVVQTPTKDIFGIVFQLCRPGSSFCNIYCKTGAIRDNTIKLVPLDHPPSLPKQIDVGSDIKSSSPFVTPLTNGYRVIWQENKNNTWSINTRTFDFAGNPETAAPLLVVDKIKEDTNSPKPSPIVATLPTDDTTFIAAWLESSGLYGNCYSNSNITASRVPLVDHPINEFFISNYQLTEIEQGFIVVWSDTQCENGENSCIGMLRIDPQGAFTQYPTYINTTFNPEQRYPTIAGHTNNDSMIAVWSSGDGASRNIRGRFISKATGLPLGFDFPLNTISGGIKDKPSVVPIINSQESAGFFVGFMDSAGSISGRPIFIE